MCELVCAFAYAFKGVKLLFLSLLVAGGLAASPETDSFRLTMPLVDGTIAAYSNLIELLASDPALAEKFRQANKSLPDTNGRDTLSLASLKLQTSESRIAAAFAKAGVTPKNAGMTMECLVGVMLGDGMLQSVKGDTSKLPAYVAENLAFYRQNKTAIQEAFKRFQAVSQKAASVFGKDEDKEQAEEEEEEK